MAKLLHSILQLHKFTIAIFLLTLQGEHFGCNGLLLKCPLYQMHLQKIVGFRPPLEYLTPRNLIYAPASPAIGYKVKGRNKRDTQMEMDSVTTIATHIGDSDGDRNLGGTDQSDRYNIVLPTASSICWGICNEDNDCIAYVHLLDTNECYGFSHFERTQRYLAIGHDMPLVADGEAIFYEKTCLKVPEKCKMRLWTLTKIPGTSLVFQGKKTISTLVTRRECAEKCLFENEFKCLSASFAPSYRNNRDRFNKYTTTPTEQHITTLGRCILSDRDKMIQPDAFRAAPYDEEYIENQCYERAIENDSCSYELYANSSFIYAEAKYAGLTQKECQAYCTHETRFYCQGVSFYYKNDLTRSECLLHSEDIISMGPRSLKLREYSVYMRRVKCLDVQVLCTHTEMAIKYTPKDYFQGKMYVSLHSNDCVARGNGTKSTLLRLPIGSEPKESRCGILRAYEVTKEYQRIFISALIVIQNSPNVQTQGDRLVKVGCIMSNSTLNQGNQHNHDDDDDGDANGKVDKEQEESIPNAIALESSLEFARHFLPNEGSLLINSTADSLLPLPIQPKITLQIFDLSHQHETNDVQIGEKLELQIIAEYTPLQQQLSANILPPLPDFHAVSLIAKTQDNQNYVLLIDANGCPTDITVFPALQRMRTSSKNILRARFHAFKFAGTAMVNFDVKIHFCMAKHCPEDNCITMQQHGKWQKRTRRQISLEQQQQQHKIKVQNPVYISTVMDVVDRTELENLTTLDFNSKHGDTVPLNYNLHVRGPDQVNSNSFIYGERGILLIAGIDDQLHLDSICLNQSLLIALLIFWLIFQVAIMFSCGYLIQKYKRLASMEEERRKIHESLEYLEGRRVHWADQGGGYTL